MTKPAIPFSKEDRTGVSHIYDFSSVFAPKVDAPGLLITYASWILPFMQRKTPKSNWIVNVSEDMKIEFTNDPDIFIMETNNLQRLLPFQFTFLAHDLPSEGIEIMHKFAVRRREQEKVEDMEVKKE